METPNVIRGRRSALLTALATLAISAGVAGCGDGEESGTTAEATPRADAVTLNTFIYEPDPVEVEAGTTVTFTNEDDILHTVTSGTRERPTKDFDEELDGAGSTAEVTFDEAGTVKYFCSLHDGMDGEAIIR